jgi:hypothetical protein
MDGIGFKNRRKTPSVSFQKRFSAALQEFVAKFINSDAVKHAGSKGAEREKPVREFLAGHLPATFDVRKGEVVDIDDSRSPELDLVVFDKSRNFPFYDEGSDIVVLPCEALLASIEVKSRLTSNEIKSTFEAAERLYRLRPFKRDVAPRRRRGEPANNDARFFHCIFAYESDLSLEGWLENEYRRLTTIAVETKVSPEYIARVYVVNRGLIDLSDKRGVREGQGQGTALMQFYMHLLNFLSRENARRKPVPYIEYAGRMNAEWQKLDASD